MREACSKTAYDVNKKGKELARNRMQPNKEKSERGSKGIRKGQQERLANESHEDKEVRPCNSAQLVKSGEPMRTSKMHRLQQPLAVQLPLLHECSVQTEVSKVHVNRCVALLSLSLYRIPC